MYNYGVNKSKKYIENEFDVKFEQAGFDPLTNADGFSHPFMPIILDKSPRVITGASWGLLPSFAKNTGFQNSTLNADIETIHKNIFYKNYINNRCLVIASHFYECGKSLKGIISKKIFKINVENEELFFFAGLYSMWKLKDSNSYKLTFTILTTQANSVILNISNNKTMPLIVKTHDKELWLGGSSIKRFRYPYDTNLTIDENYDCE